MNSSELLTLFRAEMVDEAVPYLWSDELVFSYLDDAQKMFCRRTDGISDASTVAVTTLAVVPGSDWLPTHKSILKIRSAVRSDTGADVDVVNQEDMAKRGMAFNGKTGAVRALIVGMESNKARVWPVSLETVNIQLTVFRLPLVNISSDGDQEFEVPEEHHRHLLMWCKHLAYLVQDAETFNKSKADDFENAFLAYCSQVKQEEQRKRHKPRLIAYGGL